MKKAKKKKQKEKKQFSVSLWTALKKINKKKSQKKIRVNPSNLEAVS